MNVETIAMPNDAAKIIQPTLPRTSFPQKWRNIIKGEVNKFRNLTLACRKLILANFCFIVFTILTGYLSNSFLYHETHDLLYNLRYWAGHFTGNGIGFLLSGLLLRRIKTNVLYLVAMIFNAFSFVPLLLFHGITPTYVIISALLVGNGNGMYWSIRHYMTILSTNDNNRNYVGGVEYSLMTIGQMIAPALFGILMTVNDRAGYLWQYKYVLIAIAILFFLAAFSLRKTVYTTVSINRFIFLTYDKRWNVQRAVNIFEGIAEGVFFFLPPILILYFFERQDALGAIEFAAVLLTTVPVYLLGRLTLPVHRLSMLALSIFSFLAGTIVLAVGFSTSALLVFYFCYKLANVLNPFSYTTIRMRSIDISAAHLRRDRFAFIFDSEVFMEIGRIAGLTIVFFLFHFFGSVAALRYSLLVAGLAQCPALWFAKKLGHNKMPAMSDAD